MHGERGCMAKGGHAWQRGTCVVKGIMHGEEGYAWSMGVMHGHGSMYDR